MAEARLRSRVYNTSASDELSDRELEVLRGIAEGKTDAQIGAAIFLSPHTVHNHTRSIFAKLGAHNRALAVARGFRRGLLQ